MTKMTIELADEIIQTLQSRSAATDLSSGISKDKASSKTIEFEFTTDRGLLHQYYCLRNDKFISVWGIDNKPVAEDPFDKASHIIVARQGLQVIAGGRVTISSPALTQQLPLESKDLIIKATFPELSLSDHAYCEFSPITILSEFSSEVVLPEIASRLLRRAIAERVEYVFNISPLPVARKYCNAMQELGVNCDIRTDVKVPEREEFEGERMFLSVMNLTAAKIRHAVEEKAKSLKYEQLVAW